MKKVFNLINTFDKYLLTSIAIILCASYFSRGFWHPDEHYQILELINLKSNSFVDMAIFNWDFNLKIRSWFQPWLYKLMLSPFDIDDPFTKAFIIRLFNGLIAILSFWLILKNCEIKEKNKKILYLIMIWFVPFLIVRTNSESLSMSFLLLGLPFFNKKNNKSALISGLFFGISFLIRYQIGIAIFFINLWRIIKTRKISWSFFHTLAVFFVIGLGLCIDYWGYGEWTVTPYNYFRENIINSKASNFGTSPAWYYLIKPFIMGIPFISIFLYSSLYIHVKEKKLDQYSVIFISFLLIHSLVPHKELRFLTLNYILSALALIVYIDKFRIKKWIKMAILFVNFIALLKVVLTPASTEISLYKLVYERNITKIQVLDEGPGKFEFTMPFYQKGKVETFINKNNLHQYVLSTKWDQYLRNKEKLIKCTRIYKSYPMWISKFNYFNWLKRSSFFIMWECPKNN